MNKIDYESLIEQELDDVHVMTIPENKLVNVSITKDYEYKFKNPLLIILSYFIRFIAMLIIPVLLFVKHGIIVKGRRNIKKLKTGAISISNHVLTFDSLMVAYSLFPRQIVYQAAEVNFKIPVVRHIIRLLGVVPIPTSLTARPAYIKATSEFLKEGKIVHIYPEGSLWPGYDGIRNFKPGAFHFAVRNNVPIIPICINFRTPTKLIEKFLPNKHFVNVHIGKPIYPNLELGFKESVEQLRQKSNATMVKMNKYFKYAEKQQLQKIDNENIVLHDKIDNI